MGQFLGYSLEHSSLKALVWNLHTSYVSPQYHVVFDNKFETMYNDGKSSEELDKICAELFVSSRECFVKDEYDEDGMLVYRPPPLDEVWLSEPERCEQRKFLEEQLKRDYQKGRNRVLEQLQQDFRLTELPVHIECFDNSNIQGTNPVASTVVFKNGRPSKADYRHYNIKTVEGPNDFASMEEVVYRRYKRLMDEDKPLPQLVVIDGGKGQLSSAMTAIDKLGIRGQLAIVSIAKRLEEIYFPDDPMPLYINKRSESLKLIQQLRNEAHRFAITFHRQKRSNSTFKTGLTEIEVETKEGRVRIARTPATIAQPVATPPKPHLPAPPIPAAAPATAGRRHRPGRRRRRPDPPAQS